MSEKSLNVDPNKVEKLKESLLGLKEKLENVNQEIYKAIEDAHESWRDFKYDEFKDIYDSFQNSIADFAKNLNVFSTGTLQKVIDAARNYETKVNMK